MNKKIIVERPDGKMNTYKIEYTPSFKSYSFLSIILGIIYIAIIYIAIASIVLFK